jgi:hypothetical protein
MPPSQNTSVVTLADLPLIIIFASQRDSPAVQDNKGGGYALGLLVGLLVGLRLCVKINP